MLGKRISHYRVIEKLGEGGMGVVYRAEDTRLHREVALKFLSPRILGGEDEKSRFLHEARAAAALNHPHICTVYEIDEAEGRPFMAMELVDGPSLKARIRSGPLALDEAIIIATQILSGLQEAHEAGIIHRDIKPANVMLTSKGQAKVMDFGLAKSGAAVHLTRTGTTIGTAAYMSPEQARGDEVDPRTDIWSFGVVLYEMISGRLPFRADHETATIHSILSDAPRPLTALRSDVPLELERIAAKCLQKDRALRYQHADDLLADLSCLRLDDATLPIASRAGEQPRPVGERSSRAPRKTKWRPWAAAAAVVAVVAVLAWQFWPRDRASTREASPDDRVTATEGGRPGAAAAPARQIADLKKIVVLPFENLGAPEDAYFAAGMTEEITSRLAMASGLGVISRTSAVGYDRTGKSISRVGEDLGVDFVLEGTVRWNRASGGASRVRVTPQLIRVADDTHLWAQSYDRLLEDVFAVQSEIAAETIRQLDVVLLGPERRAVEARPTENLVAYQAYLRGLDVFNVDVGSNVGVEPAECHDAIAMFERAVALDSAFVDAHLGIAKASRYLYFNGHEKTEARKEQARAAVEKALDLQPENPEAHLELGYYFYNCHLDYDRALDEFAVAARQMPNEPRLLSAIGYIWRRQGLWRESVGSLEQAFDLDPRDADLAAQIGLSHTALRDYPRAERWSGRALTISPNNVGAGFYAAFNHFLWHGETERLRQVCAPGARRGEAWSILIMYYIESIAGNYEAAIETLTPLPREGIMQQELVAPRALLEGKARLWLGQVEEARALLRQALEVLDSLETELIDDHRLLATRGFTLALLGHKKEALSAMHRAQELAASDAFRVADRQWDLVRVLVVVGEFDEALAELETLLSNPGPVSVARVRVDPEIGPLRDDPRLERLLSRYEPQHP
ncbi:MAG: protein kinase [Candidatus Eisenbacteria sp.]|nr:protein kinase [Candidatus Eisenbacteria bacterium]